MTISIPTVTIPYDDMIQFKEDSTKLAVVTKLLDTDFKDDECKITALKSALGIEEKAEEPTEDNTDTQEETTEGE